MMMADAGKVFINEIQEAPSGESLFVSFHSSPACII
jgi:hypothetical protein